ncbi:hypothetical protein SC1_00233 [Sphingopyxis sp. C-1]|nr:hypothetical protein SC1_00233 [Sphingopyxis sp. C-1]
MRFGGRYQCPTHRNSLSVFNINPLLQGRGSETWELVP